jgi:hypothetical protein
VSFSQVSGALVESTFKDNHIGMSNTDSDLSLLNVMFTGNDYGMGNSNSSPTLDNVVFFDTGLALANASNSSPRLTNNTFAMNLDGGILNSGESNPIIQNTIMWADSDTLNAYPEIRNQSSSRPTISSSLIGGSYGSGPGWNLSLGVDAGGNIDADPQFLNQLSGDLHLGALSPALDMGDGNIPLPLVDFDFRSRVVGNQVDRGAYEYQEISSSVEQEFVSTRAGLRSIRPNPFNATTTILYSLPNDAHASIRVYDIRGRLMATLLEQYKKAGQYEIHWRGRDDNNTPLATGMYFIQFQSGAERESQKVLLLK